MPPPRAGPPFEKWDGQKEEDEREHRKAAYEADKRSRLAPVELTGEERSEALREGLEAKRERERAAYPEFEG